MTSGDGRAEEECCGNLVTGLIVLSTGNCEEPTLPSLTIRTESLSGVSNICRCSENMQTVLLYMGGGENVNNVIKLTSYDKSKQRCTRSNGACFRLNDPSSGTVQV